MLGGMREAAEDVSRQQRREQLWPRAAAPTDREAPPTPRDGSVEDEDPIQPVSAAERIRRARELRGTFS